MPASDNVVSLFDFNGQQVCTVILDGEPWFVTADVCRCVGLNFGGAYGSAGRHTRHLADDEKKVVSAKEAKLLPPSGRGGNTVGLVSEPGLYALIARSNKPAAKRFDRWVRHEVLPAIRKTGGYMTKDANVAEVVADAVEHVAQSEVGLFREIDALVAKMRAVDPAGTPRIVYGGASNTHRFSAETP